MKNKYKKPKNARLVQLAKNFEPFDYGFCLDIEQEMFRLMYKFFTSDKSVTSDANQIARDLKLAIKLIDIIQSRDSSVALENPEEELSFNPANYKWKSIKYVNTKNAKRFSELDNFDNPVMKADLREEKAWHLYNLLRFRNCRIWWD